MRSRTLEERIEKAAQETDLYESTVHALLTFAAYVTHDGQSRRDEAFFGFGRRMDREVMATEDDEDVVDSEEREIQWEEVTPDLVAQKSEDYGILAEAKGGMAQGDGVWEQYIERLEKYDGRIVGWWTETEDIGTSDALLLIHRSRSRQLVNFLEDRVDAGEFALSENTAVVEFVRSDQVDTFYSFRREWGQITDPGLAPQLEQSVEVPLNKVIDEFAAIQFYDSRPPLPMLLEVLWGEFFGRVGDLEFDEESRTWPLVITVQEITDELQKAYGSQALDRDERSCEFPKESWVRQALEELVTIELAMREDEKDAYRVQLKAFDGDMREEFVRRLHKRSEGVGGEAEQIRATPDQTTLALDTEP